MVVNGSLWYNVRMQNEMLERDQPPNLAHDPKAWERGAVEMRWRSRDRVQ